MNRFLLTFLFVVLYIKIGFSQHQHIARQGQVTFFSYTSVENIEAQNNQVLSLLDTQKKEIAVSMLMRAFVFKKELMYEHFNESYVESDLYPKASFEGKIVDFDKNLSEQTKIVKGTLTIHGVSKQIDIKTHFKKENNSYSVTGEFTLPVSNFEIKIPPILASNIAKIISVSFIFKYQTYEE